ncbi:MAG: hypothetical protein ACFWTZ_09315 [Burkholderia sp.]|jgi:outer membrane usher protein
MTGPRLGGFRSLLGGCLCLATLSASAAEGGFVFDMDEIRRELGADVTESDLEEMAVKGRLGEQSYEVKVNGRSLGSKKVVIEKDPESKGKSALRAQIPADVLLEAGLRKSALKKLDELPAGSTFSDPAKILPGSTLKLDENMGVIEISVPQVWLSERPSRIMPVRMWDWGEPALFADYSADASDTHTDGESTQRAFASVTLRANAGRWRLESQQTMTYDRSSGQSESDFDRVQTRLMRVIPSLGAKLTAGDVSTYSHFDDSVGIVGVELRDDDDQKDTWERDYVPVIQGTATSHSVVTVRQSGRTIMRREVEAGPFRFDNLPGLGYGGTIEVNVRGDDGTERTYYVPYMTGVNQLKEGRFSWDAAIGRLDETGASKDTVALLSAGYGFSGGYTLYGALQAAEKYRYVQAGVSSDFGALGAFSLSASNSSSSYKYADEDGTSGTLTWQKMAGDSTQITASYSRTLSGTPLTIAQAAGAYDSEDELRFQPLRDSASISVVQSIASLGGLNLTLSGLRSHYKSGAKRNSLSAAINMPLRRGGMLSFNAEHSRSSGGSVSSSSGWTVGVTVNLPLSVLTGNESSADTTVYSGVSHSDTGTSVRAGASGYADEAKHWNWTVSGVRSEDGTGTGTVGLSHDGSHGAASVSASWGEDERSVSLHADGTVIGYRGGVFATRSFTGSAAIVRVPGADGFRLQDSADSGASGDSAVAVSLTDYMKNAVRIDPDSIPAHVTVGTLEASVVPADGALVEINIPAISGVRSLFTLKLEDGGPVPFGTEVQIGEGGELTPNSVTDETGRAYFESAPRKGAVHFELIEKGARKAWECPYEIPAGVFGRKDRVHRSDLVCRSVSASGGEAQQKGTTP